MHPQIQPEQLRSRGEIEEEIVVDSVGAAVTEEAEAEEDEVEVEEGEAQAEGELITRNGSHAPSWDVW